MLTAKAILKLLAEGKPRTHPVIDAGRAAVTQRTLAFCRSRLARVQLGTFILMNAPRAS